MSEHRIGLNAVMYSLPDLGTVGNGSNQATNEEQATFEQLLSKQDVREGDTSKEKNQRQRELKVSATSDLSRKSSRNNEIHKRKVSFNGETGTNINVPRQPSISSSSAAALGHVVDTSYSINHSRTTKDFTNSTPQPVGVDLVNGVDGVPCRRTESGLASHTQSDTQVSRMDVTKSGKVLFPRVVTSATSNELENAISATELAKVQKSGGHLQDSSSKSLTFEASLQSSQLGKSNDGGPSTFVASVLHSVAAQDGQARSLVTQKRIDLPMLTTNSGQLVDKQYAQHRRSVVTDKSQQESQISNVESISHPKFVVPQIHETIGSSSEVSNNVTAIDLNNLVASISRPLSAGDGNYSLSITLHPADLGHLDAVVTLDKGNLNVSILAQSQIAHHAISNSLHELKQTLQSSGLNVNVTLRDHGMGSKEDFQHQNLIPTKIMTSSEVNASTFTEPAALSGGQLHIVL